jgi:outer membrane protein assembly factor BamB
MRNRLVLGFVAVALAACSSGGSSGTQVPSLPWGSFRHDTNNSAAAGSLEKNKGTVTLLSADLGEVTLSTPTIDQSGNIFVGTADGVVSLDSKGAVRWRFDLCDLSNGTAPCTDSTCIPVGPISASPSVTAGGAIVVGSEGTNGSPGYLFAIKHANTQDFECMWAYRPSDVTALFSVQSSALLQIDSLDLSLLSVFVGFDRGRIQALNGIGTLRWTYPAVVTGVDPITSSPAVDSLGNIYFTSPDGRLVSVSLSGAVNWSYPVGIPPAQALQPSAAAGQNIYAIGASGAVFSINPAGLLNWRYPLQFPASGSPAFLSQTFEAGSEQVVDTVVYAVDVQGTAYGVRDLTGMTFQPQRCSGDTTVSCRTDSCLPDNGTCTNGKCSGSNPANQDCTADTCLPDNGACTPQDGIVQLAGESAPVDTSPVVSGDLFVVAGTADGRVCARALDGTIPGDDNDPNNPWATGCVALPDGLPTESSPLIGTDAKLYVTTASGLYVIE